MTDDSMDGPTIAIIGGGFSGSVTAVNLARHCPGNLRILLLNHGYQAGRGIAYGTRRSEHLLNVAARNMSALADQPNDFLEWLRTRSEYVESDEADLRETFVPRRIYGDYISSLLHAFARRGTYSQGPTIEVIDEEIIDVVVNAGRAVVFGTSGSTIEADRVVLAVGNQPPGELGLEAGGFQHANYVSNPWTDWEEKLHDRSHRVVLLGTGLTMIDAFLTLMAYDWKGPIVAVSRNGLLPWAHFRGIAYPDFLPPEGERISLEMLEVLLERHCAILRSRGENPAIVVDKMRRRTQEIWRQFTTDEKQTFCRRHQSTWNVMRHRIPSQIHQLLATALASGKLRIERGAIRQIDHSETSLDVDIEQDSQMRTLAADLVINCTGPRERISDSRSPLIARLLEQGLLSPDELNMGIQASAQFATIAVDAIESNVLYAIGPLLKGTLWETTAVPELRSQSLQLATSLINSLGIGSPHRRLTLQAAHEEMLEYCI